MAQSAPKYDVSSLAYRLKTRLHLANFKREHGYEKVDLYTLESKLERVSKQTKFKPQRKPYRFYPVCRHAPRSSSHVPISDTRQRQRLPLSSDDEDAAHLLVMMHHSPTMS